MRIRLIAFAFACALLAGILNSGTRAEVVQFHPPQPYSLQTLYQQALDACPKKVWLCLEGQLYDIAMVNGPRAAIDTFGLMRYQGLVPQTFDPHHVAHHIGHHTAMAFGPNVQAYDLCPPDYDYGCMHGFFPVFPQRRRNDGGGRRQNL
ncbi:MAG: hypothetical protein KGL13_10240 [Gammaproteobacteria bacterium]|nr:hypothetical protein [Gammaproteobacteria bacterium]MDE2346831.1 hypothetical protein [Gammaproteobacteria bacterium]